MWELGKENNDGRFQTIVATSKEESGLTIAYFADFHGYVNIFRCYVAVASSLKKIGIRFIARKIDEVPASVVNAAKVAGKLADVKKRKLFTTYCIYCIGLDWMKIVPKTSKIIS